MSRRLGIACLGIVVGLLAVQPWVAPYDPTRTALTDRAEPPGANHPLGTDKVGRDVLARLAAGAWSSISMAGLALVVSTSIGLAAGSAGGMAGGLVDRAVTSGVDLLLAFPRFVLLLNLVAVLRLKSALALAVLIGVTSWMATARLARTEVLSLRSRTFVEAARSAGAGPVRLAARHVVPLLGRLVWEQAGLRLASMILALASLDYLGIGLSGDRPTWGRMIHDGQPYLNEYPWIALPAVAMLALTSVGLVLAAERRESPPPSR